MSPPPPDILGASLPGANPQLVDPSATNSFSVTHTTTTTYSDFVVTYSGVGIEKGAFTIDGKSISLMELMYTVLSNRVERIDSSIADYANDIEAHNKSGKESVDFMEMLRKNRPNSPSGSEAASLITGYLSEFKEKYGYRAEERFGFSKLIHTDGSGYSQSQIDQISEQIKDWQSSNNNIQQDLQFKMQSLANSRNESYEMLSTLQKGIHQLMEMFARNMD